ncbi:MAG: glycosyltransferase family 2 protein [Pseudomonadota bacterium]
MNTPSKAGSDNPFLSVVIPCYNREETIQDAIESVLTQDYPDFDVIVVDDSSTDRSLDIMKSIEDPRLTILQNPGPRGSGVSRNYGWKRARGKWIAFQDSDDLWLPGKLKKQMELVEQDEQAVAVYCAMVIKPDASPDAPVIGQVPRPDITPKSGNILPSLAFYSFISTQTVIIRHDVLEKTDGFDLEMAPIEDWELMIRVAQLGHVLFWDENLVEQRFSENSITKMVAKRVFAHTRVLEKNRDVISTVPGALAHHHSRISGGYRNLGEYAQAQHHALQALRAGFTLRRTLALFYILFRRSLPGFRER